MTVQYLSDIYPNKAAWINLISIIFNIFDVEYETEDDKYLNIKCVVSDGHEMMLSIRIENYNDASELYNFFYNQRHIHFDFFTSNVNNYSIIIIFDYCSSINLSSAYISSLHNIPPILSFSREIVNLKNPTKIGIFERNIVRKVLTENNSKSDYIKRNISFDYALCSTLNSVLYVDNSNFPLISDLIVEKRLIVLLFDTNTFFLKNFSTKLFSLMNNDIYIFIEIRSTAKIKYILKKLILLKFNCVSCKDMIIAHNG